MLRDAIETYHDLLTDELAAGRAQAAAGRAAAPPRALLRRRARSAPCCGRASSRRTSIASCAPRLATVLRAFDRAHRAALARRRAPRPVRPGDWEEQLLGSRSRVSRRQPDLAARRLLRAETSRLALHRVQRRDAGRARRTTTRSPRCSSACRSMREFLRDATSCVRSPARHGVLHALLDAYQQCSGGAREPPRIAILDWREVPTYSEFVLSSDYFRAPGHRVRDRRPARGGVPRRAACCAGDFHITLIYKRVLISELVERGGHRPPGRPRRARRRGVHGEPVPLQDSAQEGEPRRAERRAQRAPVHARGARGDRRAHPVDARRGGAHARASTASEIDLLPFIAAQPRAPRAQAERRIRRQGHRARLGRGRRRWERGACDARWRSRTSCRSASGCPASRIPSFVDGPCELTDRMVDTGAVRLRTARYVDGCLTRLSTAALLNVTAGGGSTVPTFVAARR